MPVLAKIQIPKGRGDDKLSAVMTAVAKTLGEQLNERPENIRVTMKVVETNRYSIGGVPFSDR